MLQRATGGATFSGTYRLLGPAALELNPRNNPTFDVGKVLASGDVEFAGFNNILDARDSNSAPAAVLDYTDNDLKFTSTQNGSLHLVTVGQATTAAGTGHFFNFGTLEMGNHRLRTVGNNSYGISFANTASIKGNAELLNESAPIVFRNSSAISEDAAGRKLTITRNGLPNSTALTDTTVLGNISISTLTLENGVLALRGANGAIGTAFGGAAPVINISGGTGGGTSGNPLPGILHLDGNGTVLGSTAANHTSGNRIVDTATLNFSSNSTFRLTSLNNVATTETLGTVNAQGSPLFDIVKTGTTTSPVALTINTLNRLGSSTVAFAGINLGAAGANTSRIVLPGTAAGFMGSAFRNVNEWVKYDNAVSDGFEVGVTPLVALDYTINSVEGDWAIGQHQKRNGATGLTFTANRTVDTLNLQFSAANQAINTGGFNLLLDKGGIITSTNVAGITGAAGVGGVTTGGTATPSELYVHSNANLEIHVPIVNNPGLDGIFGNGDDQAINFVKAGTSPVILSHHSRTVGQAPIAGAPFTAPTWSSSFTGNWIINEGTLSVHRGQFLGGRPIIMNGGQLEINQPVNTASGNSVIPGWGNNITVNGNALIGGDDNGESNDSNVGVNTVAPLGSLTINNGAILGVGSWSGDVAFMGGGSFSGKPTINLAIGRAANNTVVTALGGAYSGSGLDIVSYGTNAGSLILGTGSADTASNTFGALRIFGSTVRLYKANGTDAIADGAGEDVIINGGVLAWGPGHHGDFVTHNNINTLNRGQIGLANMSPAGARAAGMDQINDNATVTLITGTLGETDRIQNEKFGTLNMLAGTFNSGNAGEGMMEITTANISGGTINFNWGTHLKAGTLNLFAGAPNLIMGSGFIARATTLEVGSGGLYTEGARIELQSSGLASNYAGKGSIVKLGGNVTAVRDPLTFHSTNNQGIYAGVGANMREASNSYVDLMGGTRDFNIADGILYGVSALFTNGGYSKSGNGVMTVQTYFTKVWDAPLFAGSVTVNGGVLLARTKEAFGTSAGGITVNSGGTLKLDGGMVISDAMSLSGAGATVSGATDVNELGAVVVEQGTVTVVGATSIAGNTTVTPNASIQPGQANNPIQRAALNFAHAAGITGTGTLTLSGLGDGKIVGGVNTTTGGLVKEGSGTWNILGSSSYSGTTLVAGGALRISNSNALGTTAGGTVVLGGATLEVANNITVGAEALTLVGSGWNGSGALRNVSGSNILTGGVLVGSNATIRSDAGTLTLLGNVVGGDTNITLLGAGNGAINGTLSYSSGNLIKTGAGTWSLGGNNSIIGSTTVSGGTLALDFSSLIGSKLHAGSALNLNGGAISVIGTGTQTVAGLNIGAGGANVNAGTGTLDVGNITTASGASANFAGTVATTNSNTVGLLGGYATFGGSDFATVSGGTLAAAATVALPLGGGVATDNSLAANQVLTASTTLNSLKLNGAGLAAGASNVTLNSGGLLFAGTGHGGIGGTGLLAGVSAGSNLIIHVSNAGTRFDSANALIGAGAGSLVKAGNGTLILRGSSAFTGSVNVNAGSLAIIGPGGTAHPASLGSGSGPRNINLNGSTFEILAGTYDPNANTMQFVARGGGATFKVRDGNEAANAGVPAPALLLNDANQFSGSGDLTITGGGRVSLGNAYSNFTGDVTVDSSVLRVSNVAAIGGRKSQTINLQNSVLLNEVGNSTGAPINFGIVNDIVANNSQIYSFAGDRWFQGDITLSGTNTFGLIERDNIAQNRSITLTGRLLGSGTINVYGHNQGSALAGQGNGNFLFLSNASNDFTGTINLKPNAGLEARGPGSLGATAGSVTVNMETNSRLLLRGPSSGDYNANVVVNGDATINAAQVTVQTTFGAGDRLLLGVNNLTVNNSAFLGTNTGGNNYAIRVDGTATFNADANLNLVANNLALVNGANFSGSSKTLNKYGALGLFTFEDMNATKVVIHDGSIHLRGNNGGFSAANSVELRGTGAQLLIDNGDGMNVNRISNAANLVLGGGALRVNGAETNLGTVTAPSGFTTVSYTQESLTVTQPLALGTTFTRSPGAVLNFVSDSGTLGLLSTNNQFRAQPAITIPGQADIPTNDILPWAVSGNEFVRYDSSLGGVVTMANNQSGNGVALASYINDPAADTALISGNLIRLSGANTTTTMTANRTVRGIKVDGGDPALNQTARRMNLAGFGLTVDRGLIIQVNNNTNIGNGSGTASTLTSGNNELIVVANGGVLEIGPGSYTTGDSTTTSGSATALTGEVIITNGGAGAVSLVKAGAGTLQLTNIANASTFTGNVYINSGTLETFRGKNLGPSTNTIFIAGGTLSINSEEAVATLADFGHNVVFNGNGSIVLDNGAPNTATDADAVFGNLTINGSYVVGLGGFDSMDLQFNNASFTDTPILNMGLNRSNLHFTNIAGVVSGSGFRVTALNSTANNGVVLLSGASNNTYTGTVTIDDATLQLGKAAGVTAITGDLAINGGTVQLTAANQIADASNVVITRGTLNLSGHAETINSLSMTGGFITTGVSNFTITNNVELRGTSNTDGLQINSGGSVTVGGTLRIREYGKAVLDGAGTVLTTLNVGGLELEGTSIRMNAHPDTTGNQLTLLGDVTTLASAVTAGIGNVDGATDDAQTFINLDGTRTFNVANGNAGLDLVIRGLLRNNGTTVGAFVKAGDGIVSLQGGSTANTYTGGTTVNAGTLELFKVAGTNAIPAGNLTIGDGVGGAKADRVSIRNNNQIADSVPVNIASSGVLDLFTFNTSEQVNSLSGSGAVDLGSTGTFTVSGSTNSLFSGSIVGAGSLVKGGSSILTLSGVNSVAGGTVVNGSGALLITGTLNGSATVNTGATLGGDGTINGPVTVNTGGILSPGTSPGTLNTGNLNITGSLSAEIVSTSSYDTVNVTGTVTLGGTLTLNLGPGPFIGTEVFPLIINDGTDLVAGTFTGLAEGAVAGSFGGYDFIISYVGNVDAGAIANDVILTIPEPGSVALLLGGLALLAGRRRRQS